MFQANWTRKGRGQEDQSSRRARSLIMMLRKNGRTDERSPASVRVTARWPPPTARLQTSRRVLHHTPQAPLAAPTVSFTPLISVNGAITSASTSAHVTANDTENDRRRAIPILDPKPQCRYGSDLLIRARV